MEYGLIALAIAVLAWGVVAFNGLVRLRNQVKAGWSDIDVQLMRRHDLVPNLVEAVRAYAGHEQATLESVTALRAQALRTSSPTQLAKVEQALEQALTRLLVIQEAYPDLKAGENFAKLHRDLVDVEDHLQFARRFYNGAVRALNDGVQRFPDLIVAKLFGFREAEFFEAPAGTDAAPVLGKGA
jgi:LemA protein